MVQATELHRCERWSHLLGQLLHRIIKLRAKLVRENLRNVFPQWDDAKHQSITSAMWHHLLLNACEIAHAPRKNPSHELVLALPSHRSKGDVGFLL